MFAAPRSEKLPLQGVQSPCRGALDWSMVLTTSVERPEAMHCAPSGATPTVFITPVRVIYNIYIYIYIYWGNWLI